MPLTPTGYESLTAEEMLTAIQQVFIDVFGSNFNLLPSSINGQFIQELTNLAIEVEAAKSLLYDGLYNPDVASGIWLDSICAWSNIQRQEAVPTLVNCLCVGLSGTVIPALSQVLNTNGDVFYNEIAITIPVGGSITASFRSAVTGEIPASAGTVNRIVQQLAGWDSVTNPTDGVLGSAQQTDTNLRYTRKQSLALNSVGSFSAMLSALSTNADIQDFYLLENYTGGTITQLGATVPPHSIYLSVYGGTDEEVAQILYSKRSTGCGMAGNTTYMYTDPNYSWVKFTAIFQRPIATSIKMQITIVNSPTYSADIVTQIQNAMVSNFEGNTVGIPPVSMGETVYNSRFYPSLAALGVYNVQYLFIAPSTEPYNTFYTLPITQVGTLIQSDIEVIIV